MFYFTCNESRIWKCIFWNKLQKTTELFHDIQFFLDAPVCVCVCVCICVNINK